MLASLSPPQSMHRSLSQPLAESRPAAALRRPDPPHGGDLAGLRARVRAIERGAAYGGLRRRGSRQ